MSLAILALVRNEMDRCWSAALSAWSEFADEIIVLDDASTDGTADLAREDGCIVHSRADSAERAWGDEYYARAELFELGKQSSCDWLFVLDADMVPARSPKPLLEGPHDAILFRLYDLWSERPLQYRADGFWQAHTRPRLWAVRNPGASFEAEWSRRGIHSGHLPANGPWRQAITAPQDYSLLHYAYIRSDWRDRKFEAYRDQLMQLTPTEARHAASITDTDPHLLKLPFVPELELT